MRKLFQLFLLLLVFPSRAQVNIEVPEAGCPIKTISTNPNNYNNSSDPTNAKLWNWMDEDFTVYYTQNGMGTQGFPATLRSPFFELVTNSNTLHFVDQVEKDFLPENGWELLARNFGSETQGLKNPFFMLYNKFTGTIRVFVNIKNTGNVTSNVATITLRFADNTRRSALFNQLGEATNAVNNFNKYARSNGTNNYVNAGVDDNYYWLWADFVALYDPCTCGIESDLQLEVALISETKVTLSVNGTETTLLDNTAANNVYEENTIFKTIQQYANFGTGLVTDVQGLFGSSNSAYDKGEELQNDANEFILNNSSLFGQQAASSIAREVELLLFEVPVVNSWLKFASTLITVVKKTSDNINGLTAEEKLNKITTPRVTTKNTKLKVTGNLIQSSTFVDHQIALASSKQTTTAEFRKPVYNNVLGVFNLLEQPELKITTYKAPNPLYYQVGEFPSSYLEDNSVIDVFPPIRRVEVVKELTPVLNPAAGLKIKSLESRIEFVNRETFLNKLKGPMIPGSLSTFVDYGFVDATITDRELYYSDNGYSLLMYSANTQPNNKWDKALMATPYLPQGCFMSTSLYSYSAIEDLVVKVKVVLEPLVNDPNSEVEDVIIVFTYPAKVTNVTSPVPYVIDGGIVSGGTVLVQHEDVAALPLGITIPGVTYSPLMGLPSNAYFTNKVINQDYFIIGDLTIGPNVKYDPGVHTIEATGNIYFESTPLYNNVTFPINFSNYQINYKAHGDIISSPEVVIGPETILELDGSNALVCAYQNPVLQTGTSIKAYCESNDYKTRTQGVKMGENGEWIEYDSEDVAVSEFNFNLFPNPTLSTEVFVNVMGTSSSELNFGVIDIAGKKVYFETSQLGNGVYTLNLTNCEKGIYFVTVSTFGGSQTKQLIVQ